MIDNLLSSFLWIVLIALDLVLARKLYSLYRKDNDLRKLMFTIGLLMCTPIYASAILGTNFSPLTRNIFEWSAFPILFAFLFTLLNDRFNLDLKKYFRLYIVGTAVTFSLFFLAPKDAAMPFLIGGAIFAIALGVVQYSRKFDIAAVTLFFSMPIWAVCLIGIYLNMTETALTAGFAAKAVLFLAFEIPKSQTTQSSSIVVLKKKLGVAQENFDKLFSILPDPAVIVDGKGTFLAITASVPELTGFQKEELVGTNFMTSDLITAGSKATLVKNLAKRMLGFHITPYEIELRAKDGKKMQFELNAMKIDYDEKPADMVIFRDLTERNRLLLSLEQEQKRFQSIAETTGDWIWEADSEGKYTYSNPIVETVLGYTPEELIGKKCFDLLFKEDINQMELASGLFADQKSFTLTKRCQHKDGHTSILESHGVPILDEKGKFVGYRGVDRNVTDRKRIEERMLKSERLAAVGALATMVAHDLRNPLQSVSTAVHYIRKATENNDNAQKIALVLQRINDSVQYSEKIIRDLLDFSGDVKLELTEADPKSIVNRALSNMAIPASVKVIDNTEDTPRISVDLDRIRRVIANLVSNAVEAMPNGGTLTIDSKDVKDWVELSFKDTGSGILKEKMDKLWTPFVTTKAKGMGLGLPICKRMIEAHGGQIQVESKEDKGTTFTLLFPKAAVEKAGVEFYINETNGEVQETLKPQSIFINSKP